MAAVAAAGRPLAELATVVTKFPQVLINVRVSDKEAVATVKKLPDGVSVGDGIRQALKLLAKV